MKLKNHDTPHFVLVLILILILLPSSAMAQDNFFGNSGEKFTPYTIIIIIIAIIFTLTAFLSLFLRQFSQGCFGLSIAPTNANVTVDGLPIARGLDAEVIKSIPTYFYSDVKEHRKGKVELECAVCLSEFLDPEALRLLPGCSHVFHPRCIDKWLLSHVTCPICRLDLMSGSESGSRGVAKEYFINMSITEDVSDGSQHGISYDREDQEEKKKEETKRSDNVVGKFSRSHSTGHSLADSERFTLKLSDEVNNTLVNRSSYGGATLTSMLSPRSTYKYGWFSTTPPNMISRSNPVVSTGTTFGGSKKSTLPPVKTSEHLWPI